MQPMPVPVRRVWRKYTHVMNSEWLRFTAAHNATGKHSMVDGSPLDSG
jgi:hypothetical protein